MDPVLIWLSHRLDGFDDGRRAELVRTTHELCDGRGLMARLVEMLGIVGLALRLRGRRFAAGDTKRVVRAGFGIGGRFLLVGAVGYLLGWAVVSAGNAPLRELVTMVGVGCVAVVCGQATTRPIRSTLCWRVAPVLAVSGAVALLGVDGGLLFVRVTWIALIPAGLIAAGWFDPRYAVAAGTVWAWRLLTADFAEVPREVAAVIDELAIPGLVARIVLMALGIACAALVTRASLRRLAIA